MPVFKALEGTISHCWDMVGASYKQVTVACTVFQSYLQLMFIVSVLPLPPSYCQCQ